MHTQTSQTSHTQAHTTLTPVTPTPHPSPPHLLLPLLPDRVLVCAVFAGLLAQRLEELLVEIILLAQLALLLALALGIFYRNLSLAVLRRMILEANIWVLGIVLAYFISAVCTAVTTLFAPIYAASGCLSDVVFVLLNASIVLEYPSLASTLLTRSRIPRTSSS